MSAVMQEVPERQIVTEAPSQEPAVTGYVEHPMFVPFADGHLAAVLTIPASGPRGLVLLLQGLGAPRSHKSRVWTRTARALAVRGIAAVRMDYPSMGDSTGKLHASFDDLPTDAVGAVAAVSARVTGVGRIGIVGNCMGVLTGFALAREDERFVTAASILLGSAKPLLRGQGSSASGRAVKRTAERWPRVRRVLRRAAPNVHLTERIRLLPDVESFIRSRGGLFLFLGRPQVTSRFEDALARLGVLNGSPPARVEVRSVDATGTAGFRVPVALQPVVIDSVVAWMDSVFPGGGSSPPASTIPLIGETKHG